MPVPAALPHPPFLSPAIPSTAILRPSSAIFPRYPTPLRTAGRRDIYSLCSARRRVRYEDDEDEDEGYEHNAELAMLESYTESARSEALLVRATVDDDEEVVLVFKGFSSCLSARTATDPSKSVLPARAVIRSVDVIKGPFDPSNIEFLEKGLTWEAFKARLQANRL